MESESSIILNIPQLRLSLKALGFEEWDDLPFVETEEAPEQRLMNGFFGLIEMGKFIPEQAKYRMESGFQKQMQMIGGARRVYHLIDGKQILALCYEYDGIFAVVTPDWGKPGFCRISQYSNVSAEQLRDEFASSAEYGERVALQEAVPEEPGKYDPEKLMYFLESPSKSEETK